MTLKSLWAAALFSLAAMPSFAQISNATLLGTVTDSSGGTVSGATVQVKNMATLATRTAKTGADGEYVIPDLPAAHYSVSISMTGFKTANIPDVELTVAQRALVNATLEVGAVGQEITVAAGAPMVETAESSVGQVVNTSVVEQMPLNGRNFWQLTDLTPGATYTPGGQGTATGGGSIRATVVNVTINGTAPNMIGWYLDGSFISEMQRGGTMIQPNVDALQEFNVESQNTPAEYGHTPNVVNTTLKSGTNQLHGTAFEFLRNSAFDARNFFYKPPVGSTQGIEPLRRNQYGFAIGGPIRKDKTFFFADFERTGLLQGIDFNNIVPSLAERNGDYSALLQGSKPTIIKNPATYQPFPGNIIPTSLISPQAQFFLPYMPLPNTVQGTTNYAAYTNDLREHEIRADMRIDEQFSNSTTLMGHYSVNNNDESDPNQYPAIGTYPLHSLAQNATISLVHIFSPKWINDARVSYYRDYFYFGGALQGTNVDQEAGIQGFNNTTSVYEMPEITITGYSNYTGSPFDQRPKQNRIRDWQYADNVSYSSGKHSIKVGFDWIHDDAGFINGSSAVGTFNFLGTYTGDGFADFLLGLPNNVTRDYFKQLNGDYADFPGFYAQDNFRVTQSLTLNLGVRVELNGFYNGIRGQKSAFDYSTGKIIIPSTIDPNVQLLTASLEQLFADRIEYTNQVGLPSSIQSTQVNWAPRVGFAWRPWNSNKLVIRSAFGIFYAFPDSNTINNTVATIPFIASTTVFNDSPPTSPSRTFGNFFLGQPNVAPNPNPGQPCAFGFAALSCATPNVDTGAEVDRSELLDEWNFAVQYQLSKTSSLDVAYVGNKTTHLNQNISTNDPLPGPGVIQNRRPYPQWGTFTYADFQGNANYNALQAKYELRATRGLTTLLSYAYSKCIDTGTEQEGTTLLLLGSYRAPCDYDLRQAFAGSFNYVLPFGNGQQFLHDAHGLMNQIVGGWQMTGIVTLRTGLPFTPVINGDNANTGVGSQPPNVIGAPTYIGRPTCWFYVAVNPACEAFDPVGPSAFAVPAQYTYGDGARNILRANGLKQFDFTLMKFFPIDDKRSFQFRAEMFNILNHPTFAAPSAAINSSSGGQVSATLNAARIIQLALKFVF
jgi:hypothetical protein